MRFLSLILIASTILFSCNNDSEINAQLTIAGAAYFPPTASGAGMITSWTNTTRSAFGETAAINAGFVDGTDVYYAGRRDLTALNLQPAFWKNGIVTVLADSGDVDDIFVANGNVYCSGYIIENNTIVPAYWKNTTVVRLEGGYYSNQRITSIYASGDYVYVFAYFPSFMPVVWKNGSKQQLESIEGHTQYKVSAAFVDGGDLHFAGDLTGDSFYWSPSKTYELKLSNGAVYSETNSIFKDGEDVYIAGRQTDFKTSTATVWKNGYPIILPGGYEAISIKVYNNDIYVLGYKTDEKTHQRGDPVYWKNGTGFSLQAGADKVYSVYDFSVHN